MVVNEERLSASVRVGSRRPELAASHSQVAAENPDGWRRRNFLGA